MFEPGKWKPLFLNMLQSPSGAALRILSRGRGSGRHGGARPPSHPHSFAHAGSAGGNRLDCAMLLDFFDQYASQYGHAKPGQIWCYEDGCVYRGLLELDKATGEPRWRKHLERLIGRQVEEDGSLAGYHPEEFNIDNILSGRVLFALTTRKGDRYALALDRLANQLALHPRIASGNYWHKKVYPDQVWLDGLYMSLPFQIEYGLLTGAPALVDDAVNQLLGAMAIMRDARTGLYFHGYDASRKSAWADPETGLSHGLWGRANGWLAMALIDVYKLLPAVHPARPKVERHILALAEAILARRSPTGLWLQVMDQPELVGNYEETSCSAMFVYFLYRTARLIAGGAGYNVEARKSLSALTRNHVSRSGDVWKLDSVCEVAGLGGFQGRHRDGTADYYVSEKVVANDPKGVGPLMMAVAEALLAVSTADVAFI